MSLGTFAEVCIKFLIDGMPPMAFELAFEGIDYHSKVGAKIAAVLIRKNFTRKHIEKWLKFIKTNGLIKDFKPLYNELKEKTDAN